MARASWRRPASGLKAPTAFRPLLEVLEARLAPAISPTTPLDPALLGWNPVAEETAPGTYFLGGVAPRQLPIYQVDNVNAADTTNADQLWAGGGLGLNLNGSGVVVGVWDGGRIRTTHQELTGRVTVADGTATIIDHATHVAGTIGATGVNASAHGMANAVTFRSNDFNNDTTEMAAQAGGIDLSNHSYGFVVGWAGAATINTRNAGNVTAQVWYGDRSLGLEADDFGKYDAGAQTLDGILYNNPHLLSVFSAGNDRGNSSGGATQYIAYFSTDLGGALAGFVGAGFYLVQSSVIAAPGSDGNNGTGYDSLPSYGQVAKNTLVVGAINDVTQDPYPALGMGIMSSFSSWGPADDGRVKPDVVGNGVNLFSSTGGSDTSYGTFSGTSMAAPNVTGTAALLLQDYRNLFGTDPSSATLKALLIHTAYDIWNVGPDYAFGYGLVDGASAATFLTAAATPTPTQVRWFLDQANYTGTEQTWTVDAASGSPFKVTLVWTDPPPAAVVGSGIDLSTPALVNDLDVWLTDAGGTVYRPWTLDRTNPSAAAVRTARNAVDNVEQVVIDLPAAGRYTVHVGHTGTLTNGAQRFSLFVSAANTVPTVSDIPNQTTAEDVPLGPINFTIGDAETPAAALLLTATSSNQTLLPNANLVLGGSGTARTLTATPAANLFGSATVTVTVTDGNGATATDTFVLTVTAAADTPTVTNAATAEDTQTASGLVITRNAADGAEVTHYRITAITGGALSLSDGTPVGSGTFITAAQGAAGLKFTPAADLNTPAGDTFAFQVQASTSNTVAGLGGGVVTATITVSEVNDPVTRTAGAVADLTVAEDSGLTGLGLTTLAYNPGPANENAQTLTYTVTAVPAAALGAVVLADGTTVVTAGTAYSLAELRGMQFRTAANAHGSDTFAFTVTDNGTTNGGPDPSTVTESLTITVTEVNDAPTAVGDTATTPAGTPLVLGAAALLANDRPGPADEAWQTLTVVSVGNAVNGTVSLSGTTITFTPNPGFSGTASFDYTLTDDGVTNGGPDPKTSTGTVTITVVSPYPPNTVTATRSGALLTVTGTAAANFVRLLTPAAGTVQVLRDDPSTTIANAGGGTAVAGGFQYVGITTVQVTLNDGNDRVTFDVTAAPFQLTGTSRTVTVNGGNGNNTVQVLAAPGRFLDVAALSISNGTGADVNLLRNLKLSGALTVNNGAGDSTTTLDTSDPTTGNTLGSISLTAASGSDQTTLRRATITGAVTVSHSNLLAAQTSAVVLDLLTVGGPLKVTGTGAGAVTAALSGVTAAQGTTLTTGGGGDVVTLAGCTFNSSFSLNAGAGADRVDVQAAGGTTTFRGLTTFDLGAGDDRLTLGTNGGLAAFLAGTTLNGNTGTLDRLTRGNVTFGSTLSLQGWELFL